MTPDWLLPQSNMQVKTISQLQDELNHIKIQLIDQQTKHKKDLNDFQNVLNQSLAQQKNEFKQFLSQYASENDFKIKEIQAKQEKILSEKMEDKLVELQEKLLTHFQSDSDDLELKIRRVIENLRLEEQLKTKQTLDQIEKDLKIESEKIVQLQFKNQIELFKDQIKCTMQQEHLIHKDLINSKLEKLYKSSEEKRRNASLLFSSHLGGLNFFIENAHKQIQILNQAHNDLLKNKEIVDYYGKKSEALTSNKSNDSSFSISTPSANTTANGNFNSDLLFLFGSTKSKLSGDILKNNLGEDSLIDEDLLHDLS